MEYYLLHRQVGDLQLNKGNEGARSNFIHIA
jgi:hypothetical protein